MVKTVFNNGSVVTPAFLNSINNPVFAGSPTNDGELPLITDNDLSNTAGQIKPEWRTFRDTLLVSAGTGLSCNYTGGVVTLPNGTLQTVTPGAIVVANNATNFVFINQAGAIAASTIYPAIGLPLAQVVTSGGAIVGSIVDLRPRFRVQPLPANLRIFGGNGAEGDYTLASGSATLSQGIYYFKNFTVAAGATLNISRYAKILCSGNVDIAGSIVVSPASTGGTGTSGGTTDVGISGAGIGAGRGTIGGISYNSAISPIGSSGAAGGVVGGASGNGGDGGGGLQIEAAGTILLRSTATIQARGTNGSNATAATAGAGGGGSGGLIGLASAISITIQAGAVLDVAAGNGGNGSSASGGGGGGGGRVDLSAPAIANAGTVTLTAGTAGTGSGNYGGGGAGYGGTGGNAGLGGGAPQNGAIGVTTIRSFATVG